MKKKKKVHKDRYGREFIKESYFIGGKIKFRRIYVIEGIPADEYYEKNATDLDFYMNGDYHLMNQNRETTIDEKLEKSKEHETNDNLTDLPF